jgi:DnaJ-domain-containing protein 1
VTSTTDTTADHYRLLGISPEATVAEMRAAYRRRLRQWHPDLVTPGTDDVRQAATEMTALLNEAYRCLSDPTRRAAYDATRRAGSASPNLRRPTSRSSRHPTRRPDHRIRDLAIIALGGIFLPVILLASTTARSPVETTADPRMAATVCAGVIAATIWLLTSSRLLREPDRLPRAGIVWAHAMRWAGWILVGGCAAFLGIPAVVLVLTAVFATPIPGIVLLALIAGRGGRRDRGDGSHGSR